MICWQLLIDLLISLPKEVFFTSGRLTALLSANCYTWHSTNKKNIKNLLTDLHSPVPLQCTDFHCQEHTSIAFFSLFVFWISCFQQLSTLVLDYATSLNWFSFWLIHSPSYWFGWKPTTLPLQLNSQHWILQGLSALQTIKVTISIINYLRITKLTNGNCNLVIDFSIAKWLIQTAFYRTINSQVTQKINFKKGADFVLMPLL